MAVEIRDLTTGGAGCWSFVLKIVLVVGFVATAITGLVFSYQGDAYAAPVLGYGLGGMGILLLLYGGSKAAMAGLMLATPRSPISLAQHGWVEVGGKVCGDEVELRGPHSDSPCVYLHYKKERQVVGKKKTTWKTVEELWRVQRFGLLDEDGARLLIDPGLEQPYTVAKKGSWVVDGFRHTEWRIDPGDEVYALGHCEGGPEGPVLGPRPGFRRFYYATTSERSLVAGALGWTGFLLSAGAHLVLLALVAWLFMGE